MHPHIFIVGSPLFNDRSWGNNIERHRIKCVIVKTTQTDECSAMFHYLTVKFCIIDSMFGYCSFLHLPNIVHMARLPSTLIKSIGLANSSWSRNTFSRKVRSGRTARTMNLGSAKGDFRYTSSIMESSAISCTGSLIDLPLTSTFTLGRTYKPPSPSKENVKTES